MTTVVSTDLDATEETPARGRPRWDHVYPWLLPAVAMAVVGSIGLARPGLGYDEMATWAAAVRTPAQIVRMAGHIDGVIAPYYLFLHFWTAAFGDSPGAMRLPSLIAVTAGVALVGQTGRRLFGAQVGLVAGLIVVAVPQMSRHAQDARAYGIAFFFAVLSTLLLFLAVEKPTWWRWIAYGAALTLLGATHIIGLLVLSGHVVTVAVRFRAGRDRRIPVRWAVVVVTAVVTVSPLIRLGLAEKNSELGWMSPLSLPTVLDAPGDIFGAPAVGLLVIGLAFAARSRHPLLVGELAALAAFPPILLLVVSFLTTPLWVPRYVLFVIMPLALLGAVALRGLRRRAAAALVLLAAMGFVTQVGIREPTAHGGTDFRALGSILRAHEKPGDAVVYGRSATYVLRDGLRYETRHDAVKPVDVLVRRPAADAGRLDAVECPEVTCFDAYRVWYFGFHGRGDPLAQQGPLLRHKFASGYVTLRTWKLPQAVVVLYQRRADSGR